MKHDWHPNFADAVYEAHFRADITGLRYRVFYDANNRLWNLRSTFTQVTR